MVHLDAGDVLPPQRRLGIDESYGGAIVTAPQRLEQLHAEVSRAEDDDGRALDIGGKLGETNAGALEDHGGDLAAARDEQRREHAIAEHDRARDAELARHEHDQRPDQHRQPNAADNARMATIAEVARYETIEPRHRERQNGEERPADEHEGGEPVGRDVGRVVANGDRDPQRQAEKQEVERHKD